MKASLQRLFGFVIVLTATMASGWLGVALLPLYDPSALTTTKSFLCGSNHPVVFPTVWSHRFDAMLSYSPTQRMLLMPVRIALHAHVSLVFGLLRLSLSVLDYLPRINLVAIVTALILLILRAGSLWLLERLVSGLLVVVNQKLKAWMDTHLERAPMVIPLPNPIPRMMDVVRVLAAPRVDTDNVPAEENEQLQGGEEEVAALDPVVKATDCPLDNVSNNLDVPTDTWNDECPVLSSNEPLTAVESNQANSATIVTEDAIPVADQTTTEPELVGEVFMDDNCQALASDEPMTPVNSDKMDAATIVEQIADQPTTEPALVNEYRNDAAIAVVEDGMDKATELPAPMGDSESNASSGLVDVDVLPDDNHHRESGSSSSSGTIDSEANESSAIYIEICIKPPRRLDGQENGWWIGDGNASATSSLTRADSFESLEEGSTSMQAGQQLLSFLTEDLQAIQKDQAVASQTNDRLILTDATLLEHSEQQSQCISPTHSLGKPNAICRFCLVGKCRFGKNCKYSHGVAATVGTVATLPSSVRIDSELLPDTVAHSMAVDFPIDATASFDRPAHEFLQDERAGVDVNLEATRRRLGQSSLQLALMTTNVDATNPAACKFVTTDVSASQSAETEDPRSHEVEATALACKKPVRRGTRGRGRKCNKKPALST